jgi:hypothetical protein
VKSPRIAVASDPSNLPRNPSFIAGIQANPHLHQVDSLAWITAGNADTKRRCEKGSEGSASTPKSVAFTW